MMMSAQVPEMTPLLGKLLQFGVRGYRVGRDLEAAIEDFCDQATKIAQQNKAQAASKPNPEQIKANAQAMQAKATADAAQVRAQSDMAKSQADIQGAQIEAETNKQQAAAEVARQHLENEGERVNQQINMMMKNMELKMREMEVQIETIRANATAHATMQKTSDTIDKGSLGNEPPKSQVS
jgi:hypothetical protein